MIGNVLKWFVVLVVLGVAGALIYVKYQDTLPCAKPIAYHINRIDPRFNTSADATKESLLAAADIWSKALGRELFTYSETQGIAVSLVYDRRQQTADLGSSLKELQAAYDQHAADVDAKKAAYEKSRSSTDLATLNASIAALNAEGRTLNSRVDEYNLKAADPFEAGRYYSTATGATIELYEFTSRAQLTRIAAHEFGHALGLDHNDDPASIMFAKTSGTVLALSGADLADLKTLCGLK